MTTFHIGYTAAQAFLGGVGSYVVDPGGFMAALTVAVEAFPFDAQVTPGQGKIPLPDAVGTVKAGVGRRQANPDAYVLRTWRGTVGAYLRREYAATADTLAVIVYTRVAYLAALDGPDTPRDVAAREAALVSNGPATHVVVAVLAGAGPAALSPGRLVANLAGGNRDALTWDADTIRAKAREAQAYADEWDVVAD